MKNPLVKQDHNGLIAVLVISSIAAGALAYLYLTDNGTSARTSMKKQIREKAKEAISEVVSKKTGLSKKLVKKVANHLVK